MLKNVDKNKLNIKYSLDMVPEGKKNTNILKKIWVKTRDGAYGTKLFSPSYWE